MYGFFGEEGNMKRIPERALEIIKRSDEPIKTFQLAEILGVDVRSVRYALKVLVDAELINKYFDLKDVRTHYYIRK